MLSKNLMLSLILNAVFGVYAVLEILLYSANPESIGKMFNISVQNHYRVPLSDLGLSLILSSTSIGLTSGEILSIIIIFPYMDKKGRKFLAVNLRFLLGASIALLQILSALVLSVEAFWMASFLSGLLMPIRINATMLFLSECAPDKHRGFALSSVIFGNALGNAMTYTLSRNGWLGGDMWPYISLISLILSIILFFSTWWLPESPKWLVSKSKFDKAAQSIKFYHGKKADIDATMKSMIKERDFSVKSKLTAKEAWRDETIRQAMVIIIVCIVYTTLNPLPIEALYSITIQSGLGLNIDQAMALNLVASFIFLPLDVVGTMALDRLGRRPVFFLTAALMYVKLILMCAAQLLAYYNGVSDVTAVLCVANEVFTGLYTSLKPTVIPTILIAELIPPAAKISVAQAVLIIPLLLASPIAWLFPVINNFFPPAFFIIFLFFHPFFIAYMYRNLRETNALSVYDIVHNLEQEVRSRANTRRDTVNSEKTILMARIRSRTYDSITKTFQ